MPSDLSAIVAGAVKEAGLSSGGDGNVNVNDTPESDGGSGSTGSLTQTDEMGNDLEVIAAEGDGTGTGQEQRTDKDAADDLLDDLEREMQEFGVDPHQNRIPQKRVKVMLEKGKKKWGETHAAELKTRDDRLADTSRRLEAYQRAEQLAMRDPEGYIKALAQEHPDLYNKYLGDGRAAAPGAGTGGKAGAKPPEPDVKYADGTKGYSPKALADLLNWTSEQAEERAIARVEGKYGSLHNEWQAREMNRRMAPVVKAHEDALNAVFGAAAIKEHEADILKAVNANPTWTVEMAAASVLVPKMSKTEAEIRVKLMKEMNERTGAAERSAPASEGAQHTSVADNPNHTLSDVVKEAVRKAQGRG